MTSSSHDTRACLTIGRVVDEVAQSLAVAPRASTSRDATALVAAVMRRPRFWPIVHREDEAPAELHTRALEAAKRLNDGMPFAYAVGSAEFRSLVLDVDQRALIPRSETELLVDLALALVTSPHGTAADVGTGTGAIALSLALEGSFDRVIATDLSLDALALARQNASTLPTEGARRLEFRHGDALAPLRGERLNLLVSNPPYIAYSELPELPSLVRDWEPTSALVCGRNGLAVIETLVRGAGEVLATGGVLALEVDSRRGADVVALVHGARGFAECALHQDLTGRDRFVTARWLG